MLLAVLVAGLLRSHAEILRRLHELGAGMDPAPGAVPGRTSVALPATPPPDRRGPGEESETEVAKLARGAGPVVMSSPAWEAFAVPASPYFVLVRHGRVVGEGAVRRWEELSGLIEQALGDGASPRRWGRHGDEAREARADTALHAAGIHPGHPSLHPAPRSAGD